MKRSAITAIALLAVVPGTATAAELSVWAVRDDVGTTPVSIAYNPASGKLLIAGADIYESARGATSGTLLVPADNWGGSPLGSVYIPSRGTYMVTDKLVVTDVGIGGIIEVAPEVPNQLPPVFVSMVAPTWPAGGIVQDGTYAYYKNQLTSQPAQTVNRFTLVGSNGVESVHVPQAAFTEWFSSGPSQQLAMGVDHTLYLSARNSVIRDNKGIYRWDVTSNVLVPVIQRPAIMAHTGKSNAQIYGIAIDARDNIYFYDIYSADILVLGADGVLDTFLTNTEIKDFMAAQGLSSASSLHVSYMLAVGCELVFITGNMSGHVLVAPLPVYGDFDGDGDIAAQDTVIFTSAMTGPVTSIPPGQDHERVDYNGDTHIDLVDFAAYQRAYTACP